MDEPQRERNRQRRRRVPLDPVEPPESADRRGSRAGDERQEQSEPDEPRACKELERDAVWLGHRGRRLAVALARDLEVFAPAPSTGSARKTSHASPHQAERLFELRLVNRLGSFVTSAPRTRRRCGPR